MVYLEIAHPTREEHFQCILVEGVKLAKAEEAIIIRVQDCEPIIQGRTATSVNLVIIDELFLKNNLVYPE